MRAAIVLTALLMLGVALAGCSNAPRFRTVAAEVPELELPEVDTTRGAFINDPLAPAGLQGRLVVDQGNGQEFSTEQNGGAANLWVEFPQWDVGQEWVLRYEPGIAAAVSVEYDLTLWPSYVPSYVYDMAYDDL